MKQVVFSIFIALFLTCITEAVVQSFLKDRKKWIISGLLGNVVTNPLLNVIVLILYAFVDSECVLYSIIILLECVILFTEAGLYKLMLNKTYKACLLVSAACNAVSFSVGLLLNLI